MFYIEKQSITQPCSIDVSDVSSVMYMDKSYDIVHFQHGNNSLQMVECIVLFESVSKSSIAVSKSNLTSTLKGKIYSGPNLVVWDELLNGICIKQIPTYDHSMELIEVSDTLNVKVGDDAAECRVIYISDNLLILLNESNGFVYSFDSYMNCSFFNASIVEPIRYIKRQNI